MKGGKGEEGGSALLCLSRAHSREGRKDNKSLGEGEREVVLRFRKAFGEGGRGRKAFVLLVESGGP